MALRLSSSKENSNYGDNIRPGLSFMLVILDLFACPTYDVHELRHENFKCP